MFVLSLRHKTTKTKIMTVQEIINYTDSQIKDWYKTSEEEYGVVGHGKTSYIESEQQIKVEYTENGLDKTWTMYFHENYTVSESIDWVFNCWMEQA